MESKCGGFRHEEHTADILVIASGRTLEEAFAWAGKAVFEIITDTSRVKPLRKVAIAVEGFDLENLLYKWIEELLFYHDTEGLVFRDFKVKRIYMEKHEYKLEAEVYGERFDPERHEHRTIVKAMTYAEMSIRKVNNCYVLTFVVDI